MAWRDDREQFGWPRSPRMDSPPGSPLASYTSKANSKQPSPVSSTGRSSSTCQERGLFDPFESSLGHTTTNSPDPRLQKTMFGRRLLESLEPNLNLGADRCKETNQPTGTKSGSPLPREESPTYLRTSVFVVISHCEPSARHLLFRLGLNEWLMSIGARLVLESREELGEKGEWTVILKIRERNFGVVTKIKEMLSLMSFEETSTFPICYDGWIDIQSGWKSKDQACPCMLKRFGSRQMFIQLNGGRNWTLQH